MLTYVGDNVPAGNYTLFVLQLNQSVIPVNQLPAGLSHTDSGVGGGVIHVSITEGNACVRDAYSRCATTFKSQKCVVLTKKLPCCLLLRVSAWLWLWGTTCSKHSIGSAPHIFINALDHRCQTLACGKYIFFTRATKVIRFGPRVGRINSASNPPPPPADKLR